MNGWTGLPTANSQKPKANCELRIRTQSVINKSHFNFPAKKYIKMKYTFSGWPPPTPAPHTPHRTPQPHSWHFTAPLCMWFYFQANFICEFPVNAKQNGNKKAKNERKKKRRRLQQKVIEFALKSYAPAPVRCPSVLVRWGFFSSKLPPLGNRVCWHLHTLWHIINIEYFRGFYGQFVTIILTGFVGLFIGSLFFIKN